jgi:hypothetical protein
LEITRQYCGARAKPINRLDMVERFSSANGREGPRRHCTARLDDSKLGGNLNFI